MKNAAPGAAGEHKHATKEAANIGRFCPKPRAPLSDGIAAMEFIAGCARPTGTRHRFGAEELQFSPGCIAMLI
jgi:hypothetical protein